MRTLTEYVKTTTNISYFKYRSIIVLSQGHFSSTFSVVGSLNFRARLERPLVHSMGDSEIFHVQLLKILTKNDPGNYDNFILVHTVTVVPGTSVYARLAQLLFPSINQCWWRHGAKLYAVK